MRLEDIFSGHVLAFCDSSLITIKPYTQSNRESMIAARQMQTSGAVKTVFIRAFRSEVPIGCISSRKPPDPWND
jgi:hypothetical protein